MSAASTRTSASRICAHGASTTGPDTARHDDEPRDSPARAADHARARAGARRGPPPIAARAPDRRADDHAPERSGGDGAAVPATDASRRNGLQGSSPAPPAMVTERMAIAAVSLAYGEKWVVRDVSLPVRQGEVLALIGASGSGKTTLLRSLNRLTEITAGATRAGGIALDGQEIESMEVNELRRRVSMVFQQPNPFPMSIFENVAYALREEHARGTAAAAALTTRAGAGSDRRAAPRRAIRRGRRRPRPPRAAPVRRPAAAAVHRARALAVKPEVLLLDEPCSALDPISTATIEQLIVGLRTDVAIVIVTHNLQQAMRVADHVAFMHLGELVEYGTARRCSTARACSARATTSAGRSGEPR